MTQNLDNKEPQMARQQELPFLAQGEASAQGGSEEAVPAKKANHPSGKSELMERILETGNMRKALKRVRKNRGGPGIDGKTVDELTKELARKWPEIRERLKQGRYYPQPVRECVIPKAKGGTRTLGIPTVLDRLIQQAMLQVLQPMIDPSFSSHSYGSRPGRSAHDALHQAREYVSQGYEWAVDIDLTAFFDKVCHDILMSRLEGWIADRVLLRLIRGYLTAGMMCGGVLVQRLQGTPQGSPLSPLLANLLLDEIDQELQRRGHKFVRYVDDIRVFAKSKRAGQRIMRLVTKLLNRLRLVVNQDKSAVARFDVRPLLGYRMYRRRQAGLGFTAGEANRQRLIDKVRKLTLRKGGRSLEKVIEELNPILRGWANYYRLTTDREVLRRLDGWIRRRLRARLLRQYKRCTTAAKALRKLGASDLAISRITAVWGRWWFSAGFPSHSALPIRFFASLGLFSLAS